MLVRICTNTTAVATTMMRRMTSRMSKKKKEKTTTTMAKTTNETTMIPRTKPEIMPTCWYDDFLPFLQNQYESDRSTIVVDDMVSVHTVNELLDYYSTEFLDVMTEDLANIRGRNEDPSTRTRSGGGGGGVELVMTFNYRRWYDWSIARYKYFFKMDTRYWLKKWPLVAPPGQQSPSTDQPEQHHHLSLDHVYTMVEWLTNNDHQWQYLTNSIDFFSKHPKVTLKVFNYHDYHNHHDAEDRSSVVANTSNNVTSSSSSPFETMICDSMPPRIKDSVCSVLRNNVNSLFEVVENDASSPPPSAFDPLWADRLAVAAWYENVLPRTSTRFGTIRNIMSYKQRNNLTFEGLPRICPTESQYDQILQRSLEIERKIVPYLWETKNKQKRKKVLMKELEQEHRDEFANAILTEKMCVINTTAILEDESWNTFLSTSIG